MNMTTKDVVTTLGRALKDDPGFKNDMEANIATTFYDTAKAYRKKTGRKYLTLVDIHKIGGEAAGEFLNTLES